ncbi:acyltransferase family protein [Nocardioides sp.]|uniref:acyltransferase family protein n=1 Tax=Nocardioides sp. TaxID=35761 RepID=UPI002732E30A|nr:acyltransferase family protein [Nocardioides sp.]MDP3891333.1 acyltransferase family protein [Nocardioides sp.]
MTATPTAPPDHATTPPRPSSRDPWLDNAKMTLVTLVVVGHAWVLLPASDARDTAYHALYAWHVPAFVMVTGYLSRSFAWTLPRFRALLLTVAVPYLVFEAAMALFRTTVGGEDLDRLFIDPHWPMWYLAALFLWRLVTPIFLRIPHPLMVAVVISLLGGYVGGDVLDIARTTGLLPFFVLGLVVRREHLTRIRTRGWRLVGVLGLVGTIVAAWFLHAPLSMELLYWRSTYAEAGFGNMTGPLARSALMAVAALTAVGVLALVPRRDGWFTALGPATLIVYLFHGFVVKGVEYTPSALAWAASAPHVGLLVVTAAAVAVALLLAAPPVARGLSPAIDPLGTIDDLNPRDWADEIPPRLHASATPVEPHFPGQLR